MPAWRASARLEPNDKADDDKAVMATDSHMSGTALVNVSLEAPVDRSQEDAVMFGEKSQVEAVRKSQAPHGMRRKPQTLRCPRVKN